MQTDHELQPTTNAEASIDAGIGLAKLDDRIVHLGDHGDIPVVLVPDGMKLQSLEGVLRLSDERADKPRRLRGTSVHTELASFIAHVNAFRNDDSAIFADTARVHLTAVLNYHSHIAGGGDGRARWADHRSVYACPLSEAWRLWTANSGKEMSQDAFAQFIEDNMVDLANPTDADADVFPKPAAVLEMARNLAITVNNEFQKTINPTTGESTLVNKSEHGPKSTKIPKAFLIGVPVFEAGAPYRVEARLRFSMTGNGPRFTYVLYQADAIKRDAFKEVRDEVVKATELPVYAGQPEQ